MKIYVTSILFFFLITAIELPVFSQSKTKLQNEKSKLEKQIKNTSKLIEKNKKDKKNSIEQLQLINSQVSTQQKLIGNISSSLESLDKEISNKRQNIDILKKELNTLKEEYAKMIYFAYLTRSSERRLMYVFSSSSVSQSFQRMKYIQEYAAIRKRQAALIVENQEKLEQTISGLEQSKQEKVNLLGELGVKKAELDANVKNQKAMVEQLKGKEAELKAKLKKQQQSAANLQTQIQNIIKKEIEESRKAKAEAEAKAKANKKPTANKPTSPKTTTNKPTASSNNSQYVMSAEETTISNTFVGNKGRLPMPVSQGTIIGHYGDHPHPVLSGIKVHNNGIDINVSQGVSARTIFEGTVSAILSLPNGNKALMVRHGEYLSIYSNLTSINVKKGCKVNAKQVIGLIGTNDNNQHVLHFEIWDEKSSLNPENWIR